MKTFRAWQEAGRMVSKGQRAEHYLISPDGRQGLGLYREDQTVPYDETERTKDWTEIVTIAEYQDRKKRAAQQPKVIVEQFGDSSVYVWCGSNGEAIKSLKDGNYVYDPGLHKWRAPHTNLERTISGFEARGYEVEDRTPAPVI